MQSGMGGIIRQPGMVYGLLALFSGAYREVGESQTFPSATQENLDS